MLFFTNAFSLILLYKVRPIWMRTLRWLHIQRDDGQVKEIFNKRPISAREHVAMLNALWATKK